MLCDRSTITKEPPGELRFLVAPCTGSALPRAHVSSLPPARFPPPSGSPSTRAPVRVPSPLETFRCRNVLPWSHFPRRVVAGPAGLPPSGGRLVSGLRPLWALDLPSPPFSGLPSPASARLPFRPHGLPLIYSLCEAHALPSALRKSVRNTFLRPSVPENYFALTRFVEKLVGYRILERKPLLGNLKDLPASISFQPLLVPLRSLRAP